MSTLNFLQPFPQSY